MGDQFALILLLGIIVSLRALKLLEDRQHWTLRLGVSLWYPYAALPSFGFLTVFGCLKIWSFAGDILLGPWSIFVTGGVLAAVFALFLIEYAIPFREYCMYQGLRWKAWTGPSRTAIPPTLHQYIGDQRDWRALSRSVANVSVHPVEQFARLFSVFGSRIFTDPTDLLRARAALDQESGSVWIARSPNKAGVYQPVSSDETVSLLWGEKLGFIRRCSRGIISVPRSLLLDWPKLDAGFDGRPICLAYGILARNKGLHPARLICNLERKNSFREFEEHSVFWPRPAKTLRGFYRAEFGRTFSLLGPAYITAATELALLLTDIPPDLINDWLDAQMEHQDLPLNNHISDSGASPEDLERLYRGHYATMLISLSVHHMGLRIRPELLVYDAVCRLEGIAAQDLPSAWWTAPDIVARRNEEMQLLGPQVIGLIDAII